MLWPNRAVGFVGLGSLLPSFPPLVNPALPCGFILLSPPPAELKGACRYLTGFSLWAAQWYMGGFLGRAIPQPDSTRDGWPKRSFDTDWVFWAVTEVTSQDRLEIPILLALAGSK